MLSTVQHVDRPSFQPARMRRVEFAAAWYDIIGQKGPACRYLGADKGTLPLSLPLGLDVCIALADDFPEALPHHAPAQLRLRLCAASSEMANVLQAAIGVAAGGRMVVVWAHDPGLDVLSYAAQRESMGAAACDGTLALQRRRAAHGVQFGFDDQGLT